MAGRLQGWSDIWKLMQGQAELFLKQAEKLPGPLAVFSDLLRVGGRTNRRTCFPAGRGHGAVGQQLEHSVKLEGGEVCIAHANGQPHKRAAGGVVVRGPIMESGSHV